MGGPDRPSPRWNMTLELTPNDQRLLSGGGGEGAGLAMRFIVRAAEIADAPRLIDITSAHVGSNYSAGPVGLDFARRLAASGAKVAVPATLNTAAMDLMHCKPLAADHPEFPAIREHVDHYVEMGCEETLTCAPYHLPKRPGLGEQVAWSESNAVVFANSVLGARTNMYAEFIDICAAITARVPDAGLHRTENRRARIAFDTSALPAHLLEADVFYHVLGYLIGRSADVNVPVVTGLPATTSEDQLRALGTAAAASGAVTLFHVVGVTPEAPTLSDACQGEPVEETFALTPRQIVAARDALSSTEAGRLSAVCIGTPHFSIDEFAALTPLLEGERVHPSVRFYITTSRFVRAELERRGWLDVCESAGAEVLVDSCIYFPPIMDGTTGTVMTNSAKWAHYAPTSLGARVVFASLTECARSAIAGHVERDERLWSGEFWGG